MIQSNLGHCVLFSERRFSKKSFEEQWHFTLQMLDSDGRLEVTESEPGMHGERLELLATVRGLEAVDQPSHVILLTPSRYVMRGIRHGLKSWRQMNWMWEHFGELVDIKDADLWRRIDGAMLYHHVECRSWGNSALLGPEEEQVQRRRISLRTDEARAGNPDLAAEWAAVASA